MSYGFPICSNDLVHDFAIVSTFSHIFPCFCEVFSDFHRDFPEIAMFSDGLAGLRSGPTSPGTRRLVDSPVLQPRGAGFGLEMGKGNGTYLIYSNSLYIYI